MTPPSRAWTNRPMRPRNTEAGFRLPQLDHLSPDGRQSQLSGPAEGAEGRFHGRGCREGEGPDLRFILANECAFLNWPYTDVAK